MGLALTDIQLVRRARKSDPITSHEAARRVPNFAGGHYARILAALDITGTAHEIGERAGLTVVQVDRRLPELERAGKAFVITQNGAPLMRDGYRVWARSE